jgi:hypothetical protein
MARRGIGLVEADNLPWRRRDRRAGARKSVARAAFPDTSAFSMAKTSWLNRDERKRKTVAKYADLRAELKAKKHYIGLSQLPRDASPSRVVNRCQVTGRGGVTLSWKFWRRFPPQSQRWNGENVLHEPSRPVEKAWRFTNYTGKQVPRCAEREAVSPAHALG